MSSLILRRAFLDYFKKKGHAILPSSPVIPHDDPTLLFINAGMNQFKDVFLGTSKRDYTRAATTQKCIRVGGKHNDLENVGHTSRHLTFFEMLGNFSFGDYFKKEAIAFAWEVSTQVFEFDPERIWASVFRDDDEAYGLWETFLPKERIVRFGEKENFWSMGETGPCGPCSELLYDRGPPFGKARSPVEDSSGERYLEFWNLVFMQYERSQQGTLAPLPKQSIDTGAGLERVVSLKMGVQSVFQTDILRGLIAQVEEVLHRSYKPEESAPFHVIADHIRSLSFAIADGVQPSNTDRGYVLRKILRRAVRYGRLLGASRPFLGEVLPRLVSLMGDDFPELKKSQKRISEILHVEEETFFRTLSRGGNLLQQVMERSRGMISGEDAFKLKDTYGLPLEEILLIGKDGGLGVDLERYQVLEEEAKEKSRKAQKTTLQAFDPNFFSSFAEKNPCTFLGYASLETIATVQGLVMGKNFVETASQGDEILLLVDQTPFYAEKGGQVGDTGHAFSKNSRLLIQDTLAPFPGIIAHLAIVEKGSLKKGDEITLVVEGERREAITRNHTATHLLHYALHHVLGAHIKQAGSLVEPKRLRFDFHHHLPLSRKELVSIEDLVNEKIRSASSVSIYEIPYEEAQKKEEIRQFFGEKYGASVRVVDIDFSKELCGGTHVERLGTIGLFKIVKESSIAAGVRRIEAITGDLAEKKVQEEEEILLALGERLKAPVGHLLEKLDALLEEKKGLEQSLKNLARKELSAMADSLAKKAAQGNRFSFLVEEVASDQLTPLAEEILQKLRSGVVVLGFKQEGRCQLVIAVSPDLVGAGLRADHLIKEISPLIQGGGGGKAQLAQAGGKDGQGLSKALDKAKQLLS